MAVLVDEAARRLVTLIEEVNADQLAVEIVSTKGTAFLVSADEYRSVKETVHLLQSPQNAQRLRESFSEVAAGRAQAHELLA